MKIKVYTSESGLRSPKVLIDGMLKDIVAGRFLAWQMFLRNTSAKYRQSFMGILWALLPPLATSLVWIFLNSQKVVSFEGTKVPYPVFVITGTMMWQIFSESINGMIGALTGNRSILVKLNFPRESLIFSAALETLFSTLIKMVLLGIVLIVFKLLPGYEIIQIFPGVFGLMLLGWTIGLLLIPFVMLIKDIGNAIGIILQFAMYLTPVIYPAKHYSGWLTFLNYNPVSPIIEVARSSLTGSWSPYLNDSLLLIAFFLFLFLIGLIIYRLTLPIIIERMGS